MSPRTLTAARPAARYLSTSNVDGWKLKTYGVSTADRRVRSELVRGARRRAAGILPRRPDQEGAFGVGFLIVHDTPDSCLALVDWWAHVDELHQRIFVASPDAPSQLTPSTTSAIGGVYELAVTAHERRAWLRHMLVNPAGRDIDGYLGDVFRAAGGDEVW